MAVGSAMFIGIKGSVVALDRSNGQELWKAKLGGSDFVNVAVEDAAVYATTRGEVFCLSAANGEIRWHNPLKGCGLGLATISLSAGQSAVLAEKLRRERAAASAATAAS